jgi:hypothetical protein
MWRVAVILALVALALGAASAMAGGPKLSSLVLAAGDMPTGWSVDTSPGSGVGCLGRVLEPAGVKQTASASVEFDHNTSAPYFTEKLATYSISASQAYRKVVATLNRCRSVSGSVGGHKVSGTVGALSFPRYGSASAAWAASLNYQGLSLGEDVVVVCKSGVLIGFAESDYGSPDLEQFEGLIGVGLAKLR